MYSAPFFKTIWEFKLFFFLSVLMVAASSSHGLPNVKQFIASNSWMSLLFFGIRFSWLSCEIFCVMCTTVSTNFINYPAFSHFRFGEMLSCSFLHSKYKQNYRSSWLMALNKMYINIRQEWRVWWWHGTILRGWERIKHFHFVWHWVCNLHGTGLQYCEMFSSITLK